MAAKIGVTSFVEDGLQALIDPKSTCPAAKDNNILAMFMTRLLLSQVPVLNSIEVIFGQVSEKRLNPVIKRVVSEENLIKLYKKKYFPRFIRNHIASFTKIRCWSSKDKILRLQVNR